MADAKVPVFAVVLLAGVTFFGLAFIASGTGPLFGSSPESMVVDRANVGQVGEAQRDFRNVEFGSFSVGEGRGDILAYRKDRATLKNGFASGQSVTTDYNATAPTTGRVSFEVLGRDGDGAVYVEVNGNRIFEEKLVASGTPNITVPREHLSPGVNSFKIGTTQGGISSSTTYTVEDVEIRVNDRKFHDYEDAFQVYDHEVDCFASGSLSFTLAPGSVSSQPLQVEVNGNQVYSLTRVRGDEEIEMTPQNAGLSPGFNKLVFSTEGDARYTVQNAGATVRYIGNVEVNHPELTLEANKSARNYVNNDNTDLKLRFDYQNLLPCTRGMTVSFNDDEHDITPSNGVNTIDLDGESIQESNTVRFNSNATYQLNSIELVAEKVE